jgi:hypothetical protein
MYRVKKYKLIYDYHALDTKMSEHLGREVTSHFPKGSIIEAELHDATYLLHKKRFLIPIDYLTEVSDEKQNSVETTVNFKEASSINDLTIKDSKNKVLTSKEKASGYVRGGVVGLALGVVLALYLKKNPFWWGAAGFLVGGASLNKLNKK